VIGGGRLCLWLSARRRRLSKGSRRQTDTKKSEKERVSGGKKGSFIHKACEGMRATWAEGEGGGEEGREGN